MLDKAVVVTLFASFDVIGSVTVDRLDSDPVDESAAVAGSVTAELTLKFAVLVSNKVKVSLMYFVLDGVVTTVKLGLCPSVCA